MRRRGPVGAQENAGRGLDADAGAELGELQRQHNGLLKFAARRRQRADVGPRDVGNNGKAFALRRRLHPAERCRRED